MMRSRETNVGKHEECIASLKVHMTGKQLRKKLFFKTQACRRLLGGALNGLKQACCHFNATVFLVFVMLMRGSGEGIPPRVHVSDKVDRWED